MPNSKQIVYLSQAQYAELIANGSITVDGVTVNYDENDLYVTPQAEPVTDVRINGTSIAANGVADIPKATTSVFGAASILNEGGLTLNSEGRFYISTSSEAQIKAGTGTYKPLTAPKQHIATFYGLAKAAGHDEKDSTEPLGTYTPEAKGAIQSMLGVSDIIAAEENTLAASKLYKVGDIFTAKGKLYKATAVIAQDSAIILPGEANANCEEVTVAALVDGKADKNGTVLTSTLSRGRKAGTVIGGASFAFGYNVEASGAESFAVGTNTVASGNNALAAGGGAVASGLDSQAHGWRTIANHRSQTVIGECNVEDPSSADSENRGTYVEIVGNGTAVNARSNARTLDWNGNEVLAGTITANGVNLNDEINDKLDKPSTAGTAGQVLTSDGQGGQSWEMPDVTDVQMNGTSVVSNGVANIAPAVRQSGEYGVVTIGSPVYGIGFSAAGELMIEEASSANIKAGSSQYRPIMASRQHESVFYGLAKAAGDTTQSVSDNVVGTYTDEAKSAIRTMLGAVGSEDYATSSTPGVAMVNSTYGLKMLNGNIMISSATTQDVKGGINDAKALSPAKQHSSTFYGLAKAAGDTTQSASSNAVGTYTDSAKASIKAMLGIQDGSTGTVDVSGATPTITAVENTRYVCGEVLTLSFTPAASGICIIRFTSGSTATVLTVPNTVKFPEWFDVTALETDTIYEMCITDGVYGAVMSWAL